MTIKFPFYPVILHIDNMELMFVNAEIATQFAELYSQALREDFEPVLEDIDVFYSAEHAMSSFLEEIDELDDEWKEDSDGIPKWWKDLANTPAEEEDSDGRI